MFEDKEFEKKMALCVCVCVCVCALRMLLEEDFSENLTSELRSER
jgi:hypothetical protein